MMVVSMISWVFSTMSCTQPVSRTEIMSCWPGAHRVDARRLPVDVDHDHRGPVAGGVEHGVVHVDQAVGRSGGEGPPPGHAWRAQTTFCAEFSPSTVTYSQSSTPSAWNLASCSITSLCGVMG